MLLLHLPPEILLKVVAELNLNDLTRTRQTCKSLDAITRDRSIWLPLFHRQLALYPIPQYLLPNTLFPSAEELEHAVVSSHRIACAWESPRKNLPVKVQPKMGDTLLALEMFLDRWLLIIYAEGAMYLWDTIPTPSSRAKMCAAFVEKDAALHIRWLCVTADVSEEGKLFVVVVQSDSACQVYEVALKTNTAFIHCRTIQRSTIEIARAISFSENLLVLSRTSSLSLVSNSAPPDIDVVATSPDSTDLEEMWNGIVAVRVLGHYLFTFKTRSIDVHNINSLLSTTRTSSETTAIPITKHLFSNTTFRDVRISSPSSNSSSASNSTSTSNSTFNFQVLAYDVIQGLFHYNVHFQSFASTDLPPLLTVKELNIYSLTNHVLSFASRNLNTIGNGVYTPSPTPSSRSPELGHARIHGGFNMQSTGTTTTTTSTSTGVNLSSRGFISAYALGWKGRRGVWVERMRGRTLREVQVWSNHGRGCGRDVSSLGLEMEGEGGGGGIGRLYGMGLPGDIERIVVHSISSPDLRQDITHCALSESSGLIVLGNRAGEVYLLDVDV